MLSPQQQAPAPRHPSSPCSSPGSVWGSGSSTAAPVWQEELCLTAPAAICTSQLWGWGGGSSSVLTPGEPSQGWWQRAGTRLAVTAAIPCTARGSPGSGTAHLGHKTWQEPTPKEPAPHAPSTHRHSFRSTWHHAVGGNCTHGNSCQHRLQEETQCQHRAESHPSSGIGQERDRRAEAMGQHQDLSQGWDRKTGTWHWAGTLRCCLWGLSSSEGTRAMGSLPTHIPPTHAAGQ